MREADRRVLARDHTGCEGWVERFCRDTRPRELRLGGGAERRHERERLTGGRGKSRQPRAQQLLERLGNRERRERVDVRRERPGELEREERIPSRSFVDAEQRLARERAAEPVAQEPMERAGAQRTYPDAFRGKRTLEL